MHEITLVSPFPPGRGSGGWGQQSKLKAEVAGGKEGKPPCGHHSGKVSQRPAPHAPHKYHKRPPSQCRRRFSAGVPGAVAPGKIILESPPSPAGKGVGGIGATKKANGRGGRRPKRQASHANITAAGQANTAKNKRQYRKQHAIHC